MTKFSFQDYIESRIKISSIDDEKYMREALKAAERAKSKGDIAVGASLVWHDASLVEHDTKYSEKDITNFAEMNLLRKASRTMIRRMDEAVLYSTLEPNAMCALAAYSNGIREFVFGAYDYENGFVSSDKSLDLDKWDISYRGGVLAEKCYEMLPAKLKEQACVEKPKNDIV